MYNMELKYRFINDPDTTPTVADKAKFLFNSLEEIEEEWNADVCTRSAEEITEILPKILPVRKTARGNAVSVLHAYGRWCIKNNVPGAGRDITRIKVTKADSMKERMVANPKHLQIILDKMLAPVEYETADNMLRAFCWMVYCGATESQAINVLKTDVNLETMEVKTGDGKNDSIYLYANAYSAVRKCITQDRVAHYAMLREDDRGYIKRFDRDGGGQDKYLLFGIYKAPDQKTMAALYFKRRKRAWNNEPIDPPIEVSINNIWLSGLFYRQYESEVIGLPTDFTKEIQAKALERNYNTKRSLAERVVRASSDFERDYKDWKEAFGL